MPRKSARLSPRPISRADLAHLQRSIKNCTEEVERLKREVEMNVRRMAAMQAEIDHLRARR
jgi:regulator of replication initiation timing